MPDTPLLEYQGRRAEAARSAVRQQTPKPVRPAQRYDEAQALVREALTFPDALEAAWSQLNADAEADLIADFSASRKWLREFFDRLIGAMESILEWARDEGQMIGREIPGTEALATAVAEANRFRDSAIADWPDPDRDLAGAPPTLGTLDVSERVEYLSPDEFSARLRGG
jgi:hypothetical protein